MRLTDFRRGFVVASLVLACALGSCREERDPILPPGPEAAGREYFPLAVGRFWEYDVVDHYWNFNRDSIARFQFRERVDTVYAGATGELTYHLIRARRADSLSVWRDDSVRDIVLTPDLVRRTVANLPTIELLFPVADGKAWNPNLYNSADSTSRSYAQSGNALTLPSGRQFARTVRVVDMPQLSTVQLREQEAAYAWQVGCVYRRRRLLDYCNQSEVSQGLCQLGSGYIVRGFEREEQLRSWGPR